MPSAADMKCYALLIVEARSTDVRFCITGSATARGSPVRSTFGMLRKRPSGGRRDVPVADIGRGITTTTALPKHPGTYVPVEEPATASIAEVTTLPGHQQLF
jgi:hypothetical protein